MQELLAAQRAAQVALAHAKRELEGKRALAEKADEEAGALRRAVAEARGSADELRTQLQRRTEEAHSHAEVRPCGWSVFVAHAAQCCACVYRPYPVVPLKILSERNPFC